MKADKLAEASREFTVNHDYPKYNDDTSAANNTYDTSLGTIKQSYNTAASREISRQLKTQADAASAAASTIAQWKKDRALADAYSLYANQETDSRLYVWLTVQLAYMDKSYAQWKATSLAQMAENLDESLAIEVGELELHNPWAAYYAAEMSANHDWTQTAATALYTQRIAAARGQAGLDANTQTTGGGEIALAAAERNLVTGTNGSAAADYNQSVARTNAAKAAAYAQADYASALASAGASTIYPALQASNPGDYTISAAPAAPSSTYLMVGGCGGGAGTTIQDPTNPDQNVVGCGYSGGMYGYGGLGYSYAYYDSYYYTNLNAAAISQNLSHDFWQLDGQAIAAEFSAFAIGDQSAGRAELIAPIQPAPVDLPRAPAPDFTVKPNELATAVDPIVVELDPVVGQLWAQHGRLTFAPPQDRPAYGDAEPQSPPGENASQERDLAAMTTTALAAIFVQVARDSSAEQIATKAIETVTSFVATAWEGLVGSLRGISHALGQLEPGSMEADGPQRPAFGSTVEIAAHYMELFRQLSQAGKRVAQYEYDRQQFIQGRRSTPPTLPVADVPQLGDMVIPVTLEAIKNLNIGVLNLNNRDHFPLIALELGYRATNLDELISPLRAQDLPATLARLKAAHASDLQVNPYITALEEKLRTLTDLLARRQEISQYFAETELGDIPVPILRHEPGGESPALEIEIVGTGLEAAMEASKRSYYTGRFGGALGFSENPMEWVLFVPGKPVTALARETFFVVRGIAVAGRRATVELAAQRLTPTALKLWVDDVGTVSIYKLGEAIVAGGRSFVVKMRHIAGDLQVVVNGARWHVPRSTPLSKVPIADAVGDALQQAATVEAGRWSASLLSRGEKSAIDLAVKRGEFWLARLLEREAKGRFVQRGLERQFPTLKWKSVGVDAVDKATGIKYEVLSGTLSNLGLHGRRMSDELFRMITY